MIISKLLKDKMHNRGVPGWFIHEIFDRNYHINDGELLSWTLIPLLDQMPILSSDKDRYGVKAAEQARALTDAAMQISLQCFHFIPAFKKLSVEFEEHLANSVKESSTWQIQSFFIGIRLKFSHTKLKNLIEASFWSSQDYGARLDDWSFNPMNQAAHAAHVFTEAASILDSGFVWSEAAKILQKISKNNEDS